MANHSTLILCDICGREVPDRSAKEVIYQLDRVRYRFEVCSVCLDEEMRRHAEHRSIPGFHKRAAIAFKSDSASDLPRQPAPAT